MPRLPDGPLDERAEELEETETNPLTQLLTQRIKEGEMKHLETRNGMNIYRSLKPVVLE